MSDSAPRDLLLAIGVFLGLIVAMIATMIPAMRASRTDPIRALRPE